MRPLFRLVAVASIAMACATPAMSAGKWSVWVKPTSFRDVIAMRETVWVSTADAGLLRFLRSESRFEAVLRTPGGLASNDVSVLAFDRSGRLWAGTNGKGVSRLSADGSSWSLVNAFDGLPSDSVSVLTPQGDRMWIGTPRGLALWDGRTVSGTIPDGVNPSPFTNNAITGIVVDGDTVLVGTPEGIWMARQSQNLSTWTAVNGGLINGNVTGLVTDGRDIVALAGSGTHVWRRATANWGLNASLDVGGGIGSIRRVNGCFSNLIAIGSLGMFRWNGANWSRVANSPGSTSPSGDGGVPPAMDVDGVGFEAPAAGLRFGPNWTVLAPPGPAGNDVQNVLSSKGSVYVGTYATGLSRLRDGVWRAWVDGCPTCVTAADTAFTFPGYVFSLSVDKKGRKWAGMWGLAPARWYDDGSTMTVDNRPVVDGRFDPLRHSFGWAIVSDRFGRTWMGMDTNDRGGLPPIGIDQFDSTGTYVRSYQTGDGAQPQPGLNSGQIRALEMDNRDRLWIGYAGRGIDRTTGSVENIGTSDLDLKDIPSTAGVLDVFAVRTYGESLWVLTDDGLRRMSVTVDTIRANVPVLELAGAIALRGAVHPLEIDADGTPWLGTQAGVRHYLSATDWEDFTIDNSPLPSNDVRSVTRDPDTGVFWFATGGGLASYDPRYVPPAPPRVQKLSVMLYPNPVQLSGIGFEMRMNGAATQYEGRVYDVLGRVVHRFAGIANRSVAWDGRDDDGHQVHPGLYFVHVKGGGAEATARLVVVR